MNAPNMPTANVPSFARIKVIGGPHKGISYKLISGKITIGRDSKNHIILDKDKKCSRRQAIIYITPEQNYLIKDLTKKSSVKVNNIIKIQSKLQDGDVVQFGETVLQFEKKTQEAIAPAVNSALPVKTNQLSLTVKKQSPDSISPPAPVKLNQAVGGGPPPAVMYPPQDPLSMYQQKPALKKRNKSSPVSKRFIVILLVLGGVAGFLFLNETPQEVVKDPKDIIRLADKEENIKTLTELKEEEDKKRSKNRLISYQSAQYAYVKGIRDYRKGVYTRAIESFRACKTLYPQHELCGAYLRKAQQKQEQLIQSWMIAGKDYREKRRFEPCMSSFKNVIQTIKDTNSLVYKEALENFHICKIQHEDRY